ncbi:MAG: HNH endonuclease signature motif containing protein [Lamprobacter sp.]|uniref:HNH endonuclease n=1 Tax=Lamprobacter sp. TaxID=3100796 RepID=UPI002B2567D9|nr:HNH endonuclease signature motif containing protein [Lamprobacter sp.]MEA3640222.1 HNH endonuclease signature motif containing protein [Lamprobacter sp.]
MRVESSGGANVTRGVKRRNPEYNKLLSMLLNRLKGSGTKIVRVILDSNRVANLPVEQRTAQLPVNYPVDLRTVDVEEFRKALQLEVSLMHRDPSARKGGNAQKRIRILTDKRIDQSKITAGEGGVNAAKEADFHAPGLSETERSYIRNSRLGQGQFRKDLIKRFRSTCPVTGIGDERLLVASHIKPWAVSTNAERLDDHNGLLLSALADRLFDNGLVTFNENGEVLISPSLLVTDQNKCGIEKWSKLSLSPKCKRYMEYHRAVEFKST